MEKNNNLICVWLYSPSSNAMLPWCYTKMNGKMSVVFFSCFFQLVCAVFPFLFSLFANVLLSCNEHIFHAVSLCGRGKSTQNCTLLMLWNALNPFTLKPTIHISNWERFEFCAHSQHFILIRHFHPLKSNILFEK